MAEQGRFGKGENNKRGLSFKNKLLNSIREQSLLELGPESTKEDAEKAFLAHTAARAFDSTDSSSATLLKEILCKSYASIKPTLPPMVFDFSRTEHPAEQVGQIIHAASQGHIPADVASIFIQAIKNQTDIQLATDVKERLEVLEAALRG